MLMFTPAEIAALRKALGLSAAELAAKLGVYRSAIYSWEKGESHPRYPIMVELNRLAQAAGVLSGDRK